jgi:hypothetical protein
MYASKAGLNVFVPVDSPRGKIVQILIHGANLVAVRSTYEGASGGRTNHHHLAKVGRGRKAPPFVFFAVDRPSQSR